MELLYIVYMFFAMMFVNREIQKGSSTQMIFMKALFWFVFEVLDIVKDIINYFKN